LARAGLAPARIGDEALDVGVAAALLELSEQAGEVRGVGRVRELLAAQVVGVRSRLYVGRRLRARRVRPGVARVFVRLGLRARRGLLRLGVGRRGVVLSLEVAHAGTSSSSSISSK